MASTRPLPTNGTLHHVTLHGGDLRCTEFGADAQLEPKWLRICVCACIALAQAISAQAILSQSRFGRSYFGALNKETLLDESLSNLIKTTKAQWNL